MQEAHAILTKLHEGRARRDQSLSFGERVSSRHTATFLFIAAVENLREVDNGLNSKVGKFSAADDFRDNTVAFDRD